MKTSADYLEAEFTPTTLISNSKQLSLMLSSIETRKTIKTISIQLKFYSDVVVLTLKLNVEV